MKKRMRPSRFFAWCFVALRVARCDDDGARPRLRGGAAGRENWRDARDVSTVRKLLESTTAQNVNEDAKIPIPLSADSPGLLQQYSPDNPDDDDAQGEEYGLVVFTAAVGPAYAKIATDWCRSVARHVAKDLPFATRVVVLTDAASAGFIGPPCEVHVSRELGELDKLEPAQRSLTVKTLKMRELPYKSAVYLWLDVDIRPVKKRVAAFRDTLEAIVNSQATEKPILTPRSIALTRTRRDVKYNGGLFLYADRHCVEAWERLIHHGYNATGRDQPALLKVATHDCDVVDLPEETQGYFTVRRQLDALIPGRADRAYDHALMHYTGSTHSNQFWFQWARARGIY